MSAGRGSRRKAPQSAINSAEIIGGFNRIEWQHCGWYLRRCHAPPEEQSAPPASEELISRADEVIRHARAAIEQSRLIRERNKVLRTASEAIAESATINSPARNRDCGEGSGGKRSRRWQNIGEERRESAYLR
jgi:hypothetical protein